MSAIFFSRALSHVRPPSWLLIVAIPLAAFGARAAIAHSAVGQRSEFIGWPPDLASRAPALADRIAHDLGEYPRTIQFERPDRLEILVWNPGFWRSGAQSKELPSASLPLVSTAAKRVAGTTWTAFAHDAGINVILIHFVRARRQNYVVMTHEVPAQEIFVTFTRDYFGPGQHTEPGLGIMQREGGEWGTSR